LHSSPLVSSTAFSFFSLDTSSTEIYTLSLHDALPIYDRHLRRAIGAGHLRGARHRLPCRRTGRMESRAEISCAALPGASPDRGRSEEHTSELQSRENLVCRLLLEKKKKKDKQTYVCKR